MLRSVAHHAQHCNSLTPTGIWRAKVNSGGMHGGHTQDRDPELPRPPIGAGIVLADELEYGLEPHRITRFLHSLGAKLAPPLMQSFLTTHSPVALRELNGGQLFVIRPTAAGHQVLTVGTDQDAQSTIRLYPEAYLASSVIACEGALLSV